MFCSRSILNGDALLLPEGICLLSVHELVWEVGNNFMILFWASKLESKLVLYEIHDRQKPSAFPVYG